MSGVILGESPLIPDGTYTVQYTHYETGGGWKSYKVMAHFAVVNGEYAGTPLTRYYNVEKLESRPGKNGEYSVSDRRLLVREFRALLPDMAGEGAVDLNVYKDKLIRAEVVTVGKDGLGQELSQASRYSRIKRLIEIIPDDYSVLFESSPN